MTNGEWLRNYGYTYKDLDCKRDDTRTGMKYTTYVIVPTCGGLKGQNVGDITVPTDDACSSNAKGQWVMENERWMGATLRPKFRTKKEVNVLVMESCQHSLEGLPKELKEAIKKLVENDGRKLGEIYTLNHLISIHDWSTSLSNYPVHFDYFIFENNWGGRVNHCYTREDMVDELYLANHPWKYVWSEKDHCLKPSDRNRDIEVKMNTLIDEIDALKEKLLSF